jgi:hypothetical protein
MVRAAVPALDRMINGLLPRNARLLLVSTNHGFFKQREFLADSFFEASQINALLVEPSRTREELRARLGSKGITHVVRGRFPNGRGPLLDALLGDNRYARLLYTSPDGDQLFSLE